MRLTLRTESHDFEDVRILSIMEDDLDSIPRASKTL